MSSNFEKSVKGGTKVKLAPPKSKYVEHILLATQSGDAAVAEVFRTLIHRLRDSTWTVAFKSLIIVHLMIKEGAVGATLRYLAVAPKNRLAINSFTDVQTQGQNIRRYSEYLLARAQAYAASQCDYVRQGDGRMKGLTVDKGLLRETELVQMQISRLVKCDLLSNDVENEISLTAFRLLTTDLLTLYSVENEAVMTVLSHYFEMSKPDAERAIHIYKSFCKQTDQVVQYLGIARQYEHATRLEIPKLKHAPTSLVASLQEYLDDKDFEVNRRQYLAEQEAKRTGKPAPKRVEPTKSQPSATTAFAAPQSAAPVAAPQQPKGPAPDLIDFFESIEQNQQPMAQTNPFLQQQQQQPQQQAQPTGFPMQSQQAGFAPQQPQQHQAFGMQPGTQQQQPFGVQQGPQTVAFDSFNTGTGGSTNPFGQPPLQTQFTGAGFGGYGPQPQQQQGFAPSDAFSPPQVASPMQMHQPNTSPQGSQTGGTNPFRQSSMPTGIGMGGAEHMSQIGLRRQETNPFARHQPPIQAQATGTNPFARSPQQQLSPMGTNAAAPAGLAPQATGSNPFRQSAFVNQQTGQGWQSAQQGSMGGFGLDSVETIPVFPRPGAAATSQQQSPWG